jgi:GTP pyrophosphokinase
MAQAFSKEKLKQYIIETNDYVLPLLRKAKNVYPDITDILFVLKYHICSVINSIEAVMNLYENGGITRE